MSIEAPFAEYRTTVSSSAIDYNGHMNDASYAKVLTDAVEVFFDAADLGQSYRMATAHSLYTIETHIRFLSEVSEGTTLVAESLLVSHDPKRVRLHTTLITTDGETVATGESLYLHVNGSNGSVVPMPSDRLAVLARVQAAHDGLARPPHLGRGVAAPRSDT